MMPIGRHGLVRGTVAARLATALPSVPAFTELRGNRFDLRLERVTALVQGLGWC